MSFNLVVFLIVMLIFQLMLIIRTVKHKKLTMKYASFWILLLLLMSIIVFFPRIIYKLSELAGFETPSNMIFLLGFFFLFYVSFVITTSISVQNEKIKLLIQEVSLLKERVDKNGKKDLDGCYNYVYLFCFIFIILADFV